MGIEINIAQSRRELLDLSTRNRLLSMPRRSKTAKVIEVVDEKMEEVLRLLVLEGKKMTFAAAPNPVGSAALDEAEDGELAQPQDDEVDERGGARRPRDTKLRTRLTSAALQKRLLSILYDANTALEEQGVNILYLALGALRWHEDEKSDIERFAPLVLLPISLERKSAGERFAASWSREDLNENYSLAAKLKNDFDIQLPDFPDFDAADPSGFPEAVLSYFDEIRKVIRPKERWDILPDEMMLGFFSFAKLLMYRDLDPIAWPDARKLEDQPLLRGLLQEGFPPSGDDAEPDFIDPHVPPKNLVHVVEADSSQTMAVEAARRGHSLVIQGPPGTGKSQSIANLIAVLVAEGKRVLFVAEKMAALDVVRRRLDAAGIGRIVLELHSNKTNKRAVLEELRRTKEESPSGEPQVADLFARLQSARDALTQHARRLHRQHSASGYSAYEVYGHILRFQAQGQLGGDIDLPQAAAWSRADLEQRTRLMQVLAERRQCIGPPAEHPWRGVGARALLPKDVDVVLQKARELEALIEAAERAVHRLAEAIHVAPGSTAFEMEVVGLVGELLGDLPAGTDTAALDAVEWTAIKHAGLTGLVADGRLLAQRRVQLLGEQEGSLAEIHQTAQRMLAEWRRLRDGLGVDAPPTASGCLALADVVDVLTALPDCDRSALLAPVWSTDAATIRTAVDAGLKVRELVASHGELLADSAWTTDLSSLRPIIEKKSGSWLRFLSGDYRRAAATLRQHLAPELNGRLPKGREALLGLIDAATAGRVAREAIAKADTIGRQAFGARWKGLSTDWAQAHCLLEWQTRLGGRSEVRPAAARGVSPSLYAEAAGWMRAYASAIALRVHSTVTDLGVATPEISTAHDPLQVPWQRIAEVAADPLRLIEAHLRAQALAQSILERDELGQRGFGGAWKDLHSDWEQLEALLQWHHRASLAWSPRIAKVAARCADPRAAAEAGRLLRSQLREVVTGREQLFSKLQLDLKAAFGAGPEPALNVLRQRMRAWQDDPEGLSLWVGYCELLDKASELELLPVADRLVRGAISPEHAVPALQAAFFDAVLRELLREEPQLARFDGKLQDQAVSEFRALDQQRLQAARLEVLARHSLGLRSAASSIGPMGVLNQEISKKRRHLAVRKLMKQAGAAIQALKPVFMMSPLSVAQFLEPGGVRFDVLIIDEASQVQPVDALGAIARVDQIVVVGDEKQMPPTRFFARLTSSDDSDATEGDEFSAADAESILGLCQAKGLPSRMLRWHYRSKHQSLIAVSNAEYYENKLFIVPSPFTSSAGMGLRLHHLPHAVYDRGNTATNRIEAQVVAQAVIEHARTSPELTLGVATFSVRQRQAIQDELERLRRENPDVEEFFGVAREEPFFLKNLENVQGDERDVIFISVCYGRDATGYMAMNFGPLSGDGGERRLNVLISRARRRCEVFSPITAEDIDLDRGKAKAVRGLKTFLHYARTGQLGLAEESGRPPDSPFETAVAAALREKGFDVRHQIGQSGFFVDLALVDPERPARYALGIECDGASYHSSRSARDRDRLRQSVLEAHGWIIHRIWSSDWFRRPQEELRKVVAAFDAAKQLLGKRDNGAPSAAPPPRPPAPVVEVVPVAAPAGAHAAELSAEPYLQFAPGRIDVSRFGALHEVPAHLLAPIVHEIVDAEGPIHRDEIVVRVRDIWDVRRAGSRIQDAVHDGIVAAVRMHRIVPASEGTFDIPGRAARVRSRSEVTSPNLKKPELLPPTEVQAAVLRVLRAHQGATRPQLQQAVARLLGFGATSQQLRNVIDTQTESIISGGAASIEGDYIMHRPT